MDDRDRNSMLGGWRSFVTGFQFPGMTEGFQGPAGALERWVCQRTGDRLAYAFLRMKPPVGFTLLVDAEGEENHNIKAAKKG